MASLDLSYIFYHNNLQIEKDGEFKSTFIVGNSLTNEEKAQVLSSKNLISVELIFLRRVSEWSNVLVLNTSKANFSFQGFESLLA